MDTTPSGLRDTGDAALLAALRSNDSGAYRQLILLHGGRMLAAARRIVDDDEAKDCVQRGFPSDFPQD